VGTLLTITCYKCWFAANVVGSLDRWQLREGSERNFTEVANVGPLVTARHGEINGKKILDHMRKICRTTFNSRGEKIIQILNYYDSDELTHTILYLK
jgi:hypothetical protein